MDFFGVFAVTDPEDSEPFFFLLPPRFFALFFPDFDLDFRAFDAPDDFAFLLAALFFDFLLPDFDLDFDFRLPDFDLDLPDAGADDPDFFFLLADLRLDRLLDFPDAEADDPGFFLPPARFFERLLPDRGGDRAQNSTNSFPPLLCGFPELPPFDLLLLFEPGGDFA